MKKLITKIVIASFALALLVSCGTGGLDGTYVACNDAAKQMQFAKFVFNDEEVGFLDKVFQKNTVKVYKGMYGVVIPSAEEYTYSLKGKRLIIEGGIPGVNGQSIELTYNKELDQISLNMDYAFDMLGGIAQQIGDHYDKLEEINAQLGHRKEKKANVNANQVSQSLKQLVGDVTPIWGREGADCISPNQKEKDDKVAENVANCKNEFWKNSPESFCQTLAERCAEYSKAVYPDSKNSKIKDSLERDGYKSDFQYFDNSSEDGVGFCFAYKKVGDETILAVVVRGTCNGKIGEEWKGNMNIGNGKLAYQQSFRKATDKLEDSLKEYINRNSLTNINFLITGHSRGAAVANILAADLDNDNFKVSGKKKVFAYGFATPNYTKDLSPDGYNYNNIFNFCFNDDFVTRVPLEKWGYGKLGTTFRAVAQGLTVTNPDFKNYANENNLVFNSSAVTNVINDVYELCATINDYYDIELLMGIWDSPSKRPLHGFMREYVAQTTIDNDKGVIGTALPGLVFKALCKDGNGVHKIAEFFVFHSDLDCNDQANILLNREKLKNEGKLGAQKYIEDTHDMRTYIKALETNGFCTLYLYRNQ